MKKVLLVGGDSRLAIAFYKKYKLNKTFKIYKTTRRKNKKNSIFLNFNNISKFNNYYNFNTVIIIGGVVDYNECEKNYKYAKKINCHNIPNLAKNFLANGSHVIFISTNTVFKSIKKVPDEKSKTCPGFKYAKMKNIAEKKLLKLRSRYNKITILRLTKNLNKNVSPVNRWINDLKKNRKITAFKDLYFAPILYEHSSEIIYKIIKNNFYGIFHLSGAKDISYCDFANLLINKLGKKKELLNCVNSSNLNIKLVYNNKITALKMKYTKKILNFKPIELKEVINYLVK